jgi:death-on-curing protein
MNPTFLDVDDVAAIHADQLAVYGGLDGIRDGGLLESAVAQPQAYCFGRFLHENLFAMAAAYLFHIVKNHPFVDGNKRTGLVSAATFLCLNGYWLGEAVSGELYRTTLDVANGRMGKTELAELFERLSEGLPPEQVP